MTSSEPASLTVTSVMAQSDNTLQG